MPHTPRAKNCENGVFGITIMTHAWRKPPANFGDDYSRNLNKKGHFEKIFGIKRLVVMIFFVILPRNSRQHRLLELTRIVL